MQGLIKSNQYNDNISKAFKEVELEKGYYELQQLAGTIKVKKKGSQIKTAIQNLINDLQAQCMIILGNANEIKEGLTDKPDKVFQAYDLNKYKSFTIPPVYQEPWKSEYSGETISDAKTSYSNKSKYDDCIYNYYSLMKDKYMMQKLSENLEDKKEYELSLEQVALLNL